jgi:hybrid polyketide synthase/nonribosomal peptide synthetase ACE1
MLPEDNGITPESSLVELGIDSLVAVDMRSWFHNELSVDMPVLKILGGATVAAMVDDCFTRLPRDLIPKFKEEKTEEKKEEKTGETAKAETSDQSEGASSESSSVVVVSSQDSLQGTTTPPTSQGSLAEEKVDLIAVKPMPTFEKTERMAYGSSQFWFLSQYLEDRTPFNVQFTCSLKGSVNVGRMERAIEALGQRHESFRTAFYANPDRLNEPTQGVMENSQLHLEFKKIKNIDEVEENAQEIRDHVFDLERGEVIRALLMSLNPKTHFMVFGFHHIAIDGYGFNLLLSELNALYNEQELPPVKAHFSDFAKKQREQVENGEMAGELEYWKQTFTTIPAPLPLFPMAKVNSRQIMSSYEQEESEEITFDKKTEAQIKELCRQTGATKFHFFLACLKIFLFRYLDVDDLCIGLADANRNDTENELTMGYLLNLLPLRFQRDDKQDFATAVKEARDNSHAALANSKIPFDIILDNLDIPRSATSTPLFQVFMDYRQINATMPLLGAKSFGKQLPGRVGYDLVLDITDISGVELRVNFKTQAKLYSQSSANILLKSFLQLVKSIASNAKVQLDKVPIYNAPDVKTAIELGRGKSDKILIQRIY